MKQLVALCLAGWLVAAMANALTPESKPLPLRKEQQDKLKERDRFQKEAERLRAEGKLTDAIAAAEKMLSIGRQVFGDVHPEVVDSLQLLAELHEAREDFVAARKARQEVLAIETKLRGAAHWQVTDARLALEHVDLLARLEPKERSLVQKATTLNKQVFELWSAGKSSEALPLARQAVAIRRRLLGERHPDYAQSLFNLAAQHQGLGQWKEADALYRQALEITKQALGERHPDYAFSLNNLAGLYYSQGEYAKAEPFFRQARDLRQQVLGERHPDYAISLNNLAGLYREQGEYAKAEPLLRQARDIMKQVVGERHPNYAASLTNLAGLYLDQGEYAKAELLLCQARDIIKQVLGEHHPDFATSLNNLAHLYRDQEQYAKAEPLFRQARDIYQQTVGERHPNYALSLHNLAVLYLALGDYVQAEPLLRQARDLTKQVLGEHHPQYATRLTSLATLYRDQGKYAQAEPLYGQARDIYKEALGERHPYYATSLNNLAVLYKDQGEYAKAEALYRQAIAALRQAPEGRPREFAQITAADLRPLPDTVTFLANYGRFLEQRLGGQPTAAQLRAADHACALALAVRERLRQEVLQHDSSKLLHGAERFDLIPQRLGLCQRLFERSGNAADLETALATAEQGTARVFLDQLGKARALSVGRVSAELHDQETALRRQLRELDTRLAKEQDRPASKRDPHQVGQLLDEQHKVEAELTALIRRMENDYPQYAALKYPKPCSLAEARACLAPSEVALLFVPGADQSYVVLVEARPGRDDKANGLAIYPLPGADAIADGISCLIDRDTFERPVKARAVAVQAYDLLLAPLKDRLRGKDLVIVPGGSLSYVPFEALIEDGQYLIERHRIRYAPSLTALHLIRLWEQTRPPPQRALWALADPVYERGDPRVAGKTDLAQASQAALAEYLSRTNRGHPAAGMPYPRLRFSGAEAQAIRTLLEASDGDVLTGLQATEAAVKAASDKRLLARARYVHFATHGILGLDTGQPPALVLSLVGNDGAGDAEGGLNDGFLRLDEVTHLKLNADLVVLSACETGKGRLYAGEGVTGLARAFLYAGSRGVVCSLWAVDDRETATLMTRLYSGLKEGQTAADALRAAKLAMIREGKAPVYWAPFILIGE
jgi:CHAT domain-containing protein/tetratricopeptide (TPR) repeat protein